MNCDGEKCGRKSFQWQLWESCNNMCPFCYLGKAIRSNDPTYQFESLENLKRALTTLDYSIFGNISLIGGEFFQGQLGDAKVRNSFFELIEMLCKLYLQKKIDSIWITSTLTTGDQADLYKTIDIFEQAGVEPKDDNPCSGIWICTSWDSRGRFRTDKQKKNWEFHMTRLSDEHPSIKKNTSIILMQDFCESYLNNSFRPKEFMEQFKTTLSFKQPGLFIYGEKGFDELVRSGTASEDTFVDEFVTRRKHYFEDLTGFRFYPKRETFRKFLVKYAREDLETFDFIMNNALRADVVHQNLTGEAEDYVERNKGSNIFSSSAVECVINNNCRIQDRMKKHVINYAAYYDSNECMLCDLLQIRDSLIGV